MIKCLAFCFALLYAVNLASQDIVIAPDLCSVRFEDHMNANDVMNQLVLREVDRHVFQGSWISYLTKNECGEYSYMIMATRSGFYVFKFDQRLWNQWVSSLDAGSFYHSRVKNNYQVVWQWYNDQKQRCRAITKSGARCVRRDFNDLCWQHEG